MQLQLQLQFHKVRCGLLPQKCRCYHEWGVCLSGTFNSITQSFLRFKTVFDTSRRPSDTVVAKQYSRTKSTERHCNARHQHVLIILDLAIHNPPRRPFQIQSRNKSSWPPRIVFALVPTWTFLLL